MILETERLILRPLTIADASVAFHGWVGDKEVAEHVSWLPLCSIEETALWLEEVKWKDDISQMDCFIWGFVLKESDELIGSGGLLSKYEFCVGIPRLNWETEDDEYFGYFGVQGTSLAEVFPTLDDRQKEDIGRQLGEFLRQLHGITDYGKMEAQTTSQRTQECLELYQDGRGKLAEFFDEAEIKAIDEFFANSVPKCMHGVGKYVFSHGDLGDNNILVDSKNNVGVIDFGDAGLYDITQDFRGIEDEVVLSAMMAAYGRGEILSRQQAEDTAKMIDVLVLLHYVKENDPSVADRVERIRERFFTRKETKS